jgi:hypothetical protein
MGDRWENEDGELIDWLIDSDMGYPSTRNRTMPSVILFAKKYHVDLPEFEILSSPLEAGD